jgi:hypothetical protein
METKLHDSKAWSDHVDKVILSENSREISKRDMALAAVSVINSISSVNSEMLGSFSTPAAITSGVLAVYFGFEALKDFRPFNSKDDTRHTSGSVDLEVYEQIAPKIENGVASRSHKSGLWMVSHYENGVETKREALGHKDMKKLEKKMNKSDLPLIKVVGDQQNGYRVTQSVRGKLHNDDGPALQLFERQSSGLLLEVSRSYSMDGKRLSEEAFQSRAKDMGDRDDLSSGAPLPA